MTSEPPSKHPRLSEMAESLRVKKLSEHATLPVRGSEGAAGYDLARCAPCAHGAAAHDGHHRLRSRHARGSSSPALGASLPCLWHPSRRHLTLSPTPAPCVATSAYDCVVPARGKELVKTDLSIAIPAGTYARIAPRSGLAWKNFIDTGAGVRLWFGCSTMLPRSQRRRRERQTDACATRGLDASGYVQVVDFDYRGPVGVILFNHSDVDFVGATYARADDRHRGHQCG